MKALGIILAGGNSEKLGLLTNSRSAAAMPVAGSYRALDFPLSNMSNSGIKKVAVITQYNSRSLHNHLSAAKWWNLGQKYGGLFVLSPYISNNNSFWFRGTADAIYQNINFLTHSHEPYVIIASGNSICKINYEQILNTHINNRADITLVAKNIYENDLSNYGVMYIDNNKRLINFEEKPIESQSNLVFMGIYILSRTLLINLLESIVPEGRYNLVEDIIIRYRKKLNIISYEFDGYWKNINSIKSYYETNLDFLQKEIRDLFTRRYPFVETRPKDQPPAKYNINAKISDAIVGSGSIINGHISRSVLFHKVYTGDNSKIKSSIIMDNSYIGNDCYVENAIIDKEVILSDGKTICGTSDQPIVISKHSVV